MKYNHAFDHITIQNVKEDLFVMCSFRGIATGMNFFYFLKIHNKVYFLYSNKIFEEKKEDGNF